MLHMAIDEAIKRNRKIGVLFIDWECQMTATIEFTEKFVGKFLDNLAP
jgi:predicted phosphoadenosine phosphosulfate sulfurtransferase